MLCFLGRPSRNQYHVDYVPTKFSWTSEKRDRSDVQVLSSRSLRVINRSRLRNVGQCPPSKRNKYRENEDENCENDIDKDEVSYDEDVSTCKFLHFHKIARNYTKHTHTMHN